MLLKVIMVAVLGLGLGASPSAALDSSAGSLSIRQVADGFDAPWGLGFLPGGGLLVTEREGRLWHLEDGARHEVSGLGPIAAIGQGGLLDILVPRDFPRSRTLFFTLATPQGSDAGTAVARAKLSEDARRLTDWTVIWQMTEGSSGGRHFGSRLVEAPDGHLFVTTGDRGDRPSAQDLANENGSVLRITRDGAPAPGNPFADRSGARPEIWSFGHRNPQGAALDLAGDLWVVEHGARGGDEINKVRRGANYGWPVISYGVHYSGARIGEGTAKPGMEQPAFYWDPSIAPSGMMIYSGALWPEWRGHVFVGSLKFDHISRLGGDPLQELERLSSPETLRVRDIREGPDGAIWFLSVGQGALYRITPG
jgi:glucose/arabinose dehydrogenase